jgi:hypothetical protein
LDTSRQTKNLNKLLIRILLHLQVEFSIEAMKSDPQFGGMAGMMVPTLKLLPEIIKNTTQLEIGLDLTQVK